MNSYKGSAGNWKKGNRGGCVVSDITPSRPGYSVEDYVNDYSYYGGYLVAESIPLKADVRLIANSKELLEKAGNLFKMHVQMQETGDTDFEGYEKGWEELGTVLNNILNDED